MIQFLLHIVTVVVSAFLVGFILVAISNCFAKQPKVSRTYEFKLYDLQMCEPKGYWTEEEREHIEKKLAQSWNGLAELGKQGWKIVGVNQTHYSGIEYILQRETIHTS